MTCFAFLATFFFFLNENKQAKKEIHSNTIKRFVFQALTAKKKNLKCLAPPLWLGCLNPATELWVTYSSFSAGQEHAVISAESSSQTLLG